MHERTMDHFPQKKRKREVRPLPYDAQAKKAKGGPRSQPKERTKGPRVGFPKSMGWSRVVREGHFSTFLSSLGFRVALWFCRIVSLVILCNVLRRVGVAVCRRANKKNRLTPHLLSVEHKSKSLSLCFALLSPPSHPTFPSVSKKTLPSFRFPSIFHVERQSLESLLKKVKKESSFST